ncbi:MAG: T9SS type A sorting domain-containing protein [Flavobacterium sp.]|nr:T9SS type A sorting domain-containing protein [Flavobacterium sp.]
MKLKILFGCLLLAMQLQAQCWQMFDPGYNHSTVITTDGRIRTVGYNGYGQIGDGTNIERGNFTLAGTEQYIAVSGGGNHTMGLRADGTLWTWGRNVQGELGIGAPGNRNVPTQVGTDNNWTKIWAGSFNCFALKSDGTLWSWGLNYYGQLGHPGTTVQQVGVDTDWFEVGPMPNSTFAIKTNGSLWRLGIAPNATTQIGADYNWVMVDGGDAHFIALKNDGSIYTSGNNDQGQLGNPVANPDGNPMRRVGTDNDWTTVNAGEDYCMAIKSDGSLWAWGNGSYGVLGMGMSQDFDTPQRVGTANDWLAVKSHGAHSMALKTDGRLYSWGENTYGQLGVFNAISNIPNLNLCPTSLDTKSFDQDTFAVFPNPVNGILTINNPQSLPIVGFRIIDQTGKIVKENWGNSNQIDVTNLATGLYFLEIQGATTSFLKFIKQ